MDLFDTCPGCPGYWVRERLRILTLRISDSQLNAENLQRTFKYTGSGKRFQRFKKGGISAGVCLAGVCLSCKNLKFEVVSVQCRPATQEAQSELCLITRQYQVITAEWLDTRGN